MSSRQRSRGRGILAILVLLLTAGLLMGAGGEPKNSGGSDGGGRTLKWSLQLSSKLSPANETRYRGIISGILKNPQGWSRVGRGFEYVSDPKQADYAITIETPEAIDRHCDGDFLYGCAKFVLNPCPIRLGEHVFASTDLATHVVDHEFGHCLGLQHKEGTLMQARGAEDVLYPSDDEITEAKKHLP